MGKKNALDFCGTEVLWVNFDDNSAALGVVALLLHAGVAPPIYREDVRHDVHHDGMRTLLLLRRLGRLSRQTLAQGESLLWQERNLRVQAAEACATCPRRNP
jgi:hypothetical protein